MSTEAEQLGVECLKILETVRKIQVFTTIPMQIPEVFFANYYSTVLAVRSICEEMLGLILALLLVALFGYKWWKNRPKWPNKMPPGPPVYPIIGSPVIFKYPHITVAFEELHKQYGKFELNCMS